MAQDAKSQKDLTLIQKLRSLGYEVYQGQAISKDQQSGEVLAKQQPQLLISKLLALPGWSRERLAQAIGVSPRTIRYWENGNTIPKPSHWELLVYYFELFVNHLYKDYNVIGIRINEDPLTPQNLALTITALTELTTKLWLIAKRRLSDLIEYTQTHDVRFANEAGTTIAWITYNSPLNFGFQVDKLIPGIAEATMTVVDGLTQRKSKREKLELENQITAQAITEAEQKLKQKKEMAPLEREKQELELEKQRLEIEKERQVLVEQRLASQKKQIEDALELAGKTVDIVYPNVDPELRSVLIQTVLNNILQLHNVNGLELALPKPKDQENQ